MDDNEDAVYSLEKLLNLMGYDAKATTSGRVALAEGATFRPDVILLDLGMPDMDGFETAQLIQNEDWGVGVLIVALTGWGAAEDRRRTRHAGFYGHLVKPLNLQELFQLLGLGGSFGES